MSNKSYLVLGFTFGMLFIIVGIGSGIEDGRLFEGFFAGLVCSVVTMTTGLLLYGVDKFVSTRKQE